MFGLTKSPLDSEKLVVEKLPGSLGERGFKNKIISEEYFKSLDCP